MLGIMLPTWFLSMWMSNTATAAMMIPILSAILSQMKTVKENGKSLCDSLCNIPWSYSAIKRLVPLCRATPNI